MGEGKQEKVYKDFFSLSQLLCETSAAPLQILGYGMFRPEQPMGRIFANRAEEQEDLMSERKNVIST